MRKDSSYLKNLMPKVFRTEGDVVPFDPVKIEQSLIKETGLSKDIASKITELLVRRVISSGIKFLSGPHIREIVCSILSEQHYEEERKLYTRIGMPLMDYEQLLERDYNVKINEISNPEKIHHIAANQLAEEYSLLRILNDEESHAHLYGDIHIHQLKYFDLRPCSQVWDPRLILKYGLLPVQNFKQISKFGPPKNLLEATYQLARWIIMVQNEFSESQRLEFLSIFLAPYIRGLSEEQIEKILKIFIFDLNQISMVTATNIFNASISWTPTIVNKILDLNAIGPNGKEKGVYEEYLDESLNIFNIITKIYIDGDFNKNSFKYPKRFVFINDIWLKKFEESYDNIIKEIIKTSNPFFINLNPKWVKEQYLKYYNEHFSNYGILQKIFINLPRIAYLSPKEDLFLENLKQKMEICFNILLKKYEMIKKRLKTKNLPICSSIVENHPIFDLDLQDLAIGFVGLNEAIKHLTNLELHESNEAFALGKKLITEMKKICDEKSRILNKNFTLIDCNLNEISLRFAKLDVKHFSKAIKIKDFSKKENIYHNSACFNEKSNISLTECISKRAEIHQLIKRGIIEHISLRKYKQNFQKTQDYKDFLRYICKNTNITQFKFEL